MLYFVVGTSTPKKIGANSDVRSPLEFPNFEDLSLEMNKKSVVTYKKVKATRKRRSELVFTKLVGKSLIEVKTYILNNFTLYSRSSNKRELIF